MKYIFSITLLLLSFLTAGAQSVKNETSWTDGDATYHTEYRTMNTERGEESVIFFYGMSPHEGGFEFVLRPVPGKTGEYTLYADESDYVPLNGNVGDRVQHLQKDGINALIVRNAQGRATDVLVRDRGEIIRIWERDLTSIFAGKDRSRIPVPEAESSRRRSATSGPLRTRRSHPAEAQLKRRSTTSNFGTIRRTCSASTNNCGS